MAYAVCRRLPFSVGFDRDDCNLRSVLPRDLWVCAPVGRQADDALVFDHLAGRSSTSFRLVYIGILKMDINIPAIINKPAIFVGEISFSIYIVHRIIELNLAKILEWRSIQFTSNDKIDAIITCTIIEIPIVIAIGTLVYYAIEKPFHAFKKPYIIK